MLENFTKFHISDLIISDTSAIQIQDFCYVQSNISIQLENKWNENIFLLRHNNVHINKLF